MPQGKLTELARETDEIAASLVHLTERKFILAAELDDFLLRLADEQPPNNPVRALEPVDQKERHRQAPAPPFQPI